MTRLLTAALALAFTVHAAALADAERILSWDDLMPEGEAERLAQFTDTDIMSLFGHGEAGDEGTPIPFLQKGTLNTVPELDGASVAIDGYVVPFDFAPGGEIREFLFVPYYGACIHVPPPPQNQMIYVTTDEPIVLERMWDPVRIHGVLATEAQMSELGDAAYSMDLTRLEMRRGR